MVDGLFTPFPLFGTTLRNRIVMSPMTRNRSTADGVPTNENVEYYRQRASAGLIITEGTYPSPMGRGYLFTPGIFSDEQIIGWRKITDAVHQEGGRIVCQLMHCGRLSDPLLLPGQACPVAPSAVQPAREGLFTFHTPRPNRPYPVPRALSGDEISHVLNEYRIATENAVRAGFDGVEIHAGNGYLPMQFLATNVNLRNDRYGGSIEGRCQFILNLIDVMGKVAGTDYIGVRLHPGQSFADILDDDPIATYTYLVPRLAQRKIAYIHLSRRPVGWDVVKTLHPLFDGAVIVGGGFARSTANETIATKNADLVAFGQAYIANPDLVTRYHNGWTLNRPDPATYYTQGSEGYTSYPIYEKRDRAEQVSPDEAFGSALTNIPDTKKTDRK